VDVEGTKLRRARSNVPGQAAGTRGGEPGLELPEELYTGASGSIDVTSNRWTGSHGAIAVLRSRGHREARVASSTALKSHGL
jgi:hypothetical protein